MQRDDATKTLHTKLLNCLQKLNVFRTSLFDVKRLKCRAPSIVGRDIKYVVYVDNDISYIDVGIHNLRITLLNISNEMAERINAQAHEFPIITSIISFSP